MPSAINVMTSKGPDGLCKLSSLDDYIHVENTDESKLLEDVLLLCTNKPQDYRKKVDVISDLFQQFLS